MVGADNHLLLVDLRTFDDELTGKMAQAVLDDAGITLNKNTVPGEKRSPMVTSGVRIGTPAMTTRGLKVDDARIVAGWIADAIERREDPEALKLLHGQVVEMCRRFPVYAGELAG